MNTYLIMIKSHCEAPGFDDVIEAKNKKEAVNILYEELKWDDKKYIAENTVRLYKNGKLQ